MPKVSVIIPVYNVEKYIERCARSLFEQTLDDIEYIFVNDCSSDASMIVLKNIIENYPNRSQQVRIINHTSNTGQSGARWSGMSKAQGDYVIHCDADDWVEKDMYEKLYQMIEKAQADAACCDMLMEFPQNQVHLKYNSSFPDHQLMYDCIAPISVEYFSMCNRLVARRIYEQHHIEPFQGINMWDDVGMSTRIRFYLNKTVVISEPLYHYNRCNELSTTNRPLLGRVNEAINCVRYLEKFFYMEGVGEKYIRFISMLKIISKIDLFEYDMRLWQDTFPETRPYLNLVKKQCSSKQYIKFCIVAYLKSFGRFLLNQWSHL